MTAPMTALVLADDRILRLRDPLRATLATALTLGLRVGAPLTLPELAAARHRAPATVRRHLRALAALGWPLLIRRDRLLLVDAQQVALRAVAPSPPAPATPTSGQGRATDEPVGGERASAQPQPAGWDESPAAHAAAGVKMDTPAAVGRDIEQKDPREDQEAAAEEAAAQASAAAASLDSPTGGPQAAGQAQQARAALVELGVYPETATDLARLPWATPLLVRRCAAALATRPQIHSLAGVLVKVLRNRDGAVALARSAPQRLARHKMQAAYARQEAAAPAAGRDPALAALRTLWRRALVRLETTWDAQAVRAYLQPATPLGAENGVLLLAAASVEACEWLNARARGAVLTALGRDAARPPGLPGAINAVQFVVARNGDLAGAH